MARGLGHLRPSKRSMRLVRVPNNINQNHRTPKRIRLIDGLVKNTSLKSNRDMANIRFKGLKFIKNIEVPALRVIDTVVSYQTYGLGDGLWSIEAKTSYDQSCYGPSCKEWVGSNGTRDDEEADDL